MVQTALCELFGKGLKLTLICLLEKSPTFQIKVNLAFSFLSPKDSNTVQCWVFEPKLALKQQVYWENCTKFLTLTGISTYY